LVTTRSGDASFLEPRCNCGWIFRILRFPSSVTCKRH
jgi:hypothetical protein